MTRRRRRVNVDPASNRAVLYLRRSKDDGPGSIPVQQEAGQSYAARAGLLIVETVIDQESAYLDNSVGRRGYLRVLEMARAGAVHHIIVWQLTRFGRDAGEIMARTKELQRLGVALHSTSEDLTNKLLLGFLAVLAEEESDRISERVSARKRQLAATGRFGGGTPPYGTVVNDGSLAPGPRFPVVRAVYERAAAGASPIEIAAEVSEAFALVPPINARLVWRILTNPGYIGILRAELPDGPGETRGQWAPMIDPDLRAAALAGIRRARRTRSGESWQPRTWLRGLLVCAVCGRSCHLLRSPNWQGRVYFYLRCNAICPGVRWRQDTIEEWVADKLRALTLPPEDAPLIRAAVAAFNTERDRAAGMAELSEERARLIARRDRIEALLIDGVLDPSRGKERLREVGATLASVEARLALAPPADHVDADEAVALLTSSALHERRFTDPAAYAEAIRSWVVAVRLPPKPATPALEWTEFARLLILRKEKE